MDIKKLIIQVLVAIFLFTLVAVILEKEYTQEVIFEKLQTAVVFGLIYGAFLWAREKFKNRKQ